MIYYIQREGESPNPKTYIYKENKIMQYVYILTRRDEYAPAQHDDQIIGCYAKEQDLIDMLKEAYPNMEQRGNCIYPNDKWHTNTTYIITERPVL